MNSLFQVAYDLQQLLETKQRRFAFIGGVALQRWGEPRVTQDVGVTVFTEFGAQEEVISDLLNHYAPRIPQADEFARDTRVLLLQSTNNIGIDLALGALDFEEEMIRRATKYEYLPGICLQTCSAEDLMIMKAFAAHDRDWADIRGILVRQSDLDWEYIMKHLEPLVELKEQPEILERLQKLRAERL